MIWNFFEIESFLLNNLQKGQNLYDFYLAMEMQHVCIW